MSAATSVSLHTHMAWKWATFLLLAFLHINCDTDNKIRHMRENRSGNLSVSKVLRVRKSGIEGTHGF